MISLQHFVMGVLAQNANKMCIYYRLQRSCGKVMFSQAPVILFTGGGGACMETRVCVAGRMHGRVCVWQGDMYGRGRVCVAGECG